VSRILTQFDFEGFCHLVKYYAVELASLIVFLWWLGRAVLRELGYRKKRRQKNGTSSSEGAQV